MNDQELVKRLQCGHGEWANEMTVIGCNPFRAVHPNRCGWEPEGLSTFFSLGRKKQEGKNGRNAFGVGAKIQFSEKNILGFGAL